MRQVLGRRESLPGWLSSRTSAYQRVGVTHLTLSLLWGSRNTHTSWVLRKSVFTGIRNITCMHTRHQGQGGAPAPLTHQTSQTNTSSKIKIARIPRWRPQSFKPGVGPGQRGACGNTQVAPTKPGSGAGKQSWEWRFSQLSLFPGLFVAQ